MDSISKEKWEKGQHADTVTGNYRHHFLKRDHYVRDALKRHTSPKSKAIELGCGDGNNLGLLSSYFNNLYACDSNSVRVKRVKDRFPNVKIFQWDITDIITQERFDFVLLNHVLEHIPNTLQVLSEVRYIMNDGALLLIGVPNEGAFFWQLAYKLQPKSLENTEHIKFFTKKTLIEKSKEAGFTPVEFKYIGWGVPHWSIDSRLRKYKIIDDVFETIGRRLIPSQATSMYLLVKK